MTQPTSTLRIASDSLSADVALLGAELQNLCDAAGRRLQWDGDPAVWTGRAPILFPVIGVLEGGCYRLDGRSYEMPKHGFARHATFDVVAHEASQAVLRLVPTDAIRASYPFDFALEVAFAMTGATLTVTATIANRDTRPMPASFGFHPALRWPLPYGQPRADHFLRFDHAEPAPIRRINGNGFLVPEHLPTPIVGDVLELRDDLFDDDAVIFDGLTSRRVTYGASTGPRVEVRFDDFATLGVWTKPGGAQFVCIEPWQGFADPIGFTGEIWDKPGIVAIAAGATRSFTMAIGVDGMPAR